MKNTITNILWWMINKLDPLSVEQLNVSPFEINFKLSKRYYQKNKWTMTTLTINFWGMKGDENVSSQIAEFSLYKDTELAAKEISNGYFFHK